jgi:hypothetical protein
VVVTELQIEIKRLIIRSGRRKLVLNYQGQAPSDLGKLIGQEVEISQRAIYLKDEMIAWVVGRDLCEFMVDSIGDIINAVD